MQTFPLWRLSSLPSPAAATTPSFFSVSSSSFSQPLLSLSQLHRHHHRRRHHHHHHPPSQCFNGFLAKADGKDKLTALIQYAAMFVSAGEPGNAKKVQGSVAAARKVFRVFRPLESATPVLLNPRLDASGGPAARKDALAKLKSLLMALYFAGDHVVWASQAGVTADRRLVDRWQRISLYSWCGGSVITIVQECEEIGALASTRGAGEALADWRRRQAAAAAEIDRRLLTLLHAVSQALLAVGLLQLRPWKPRTVGLIGIVASAINCYMLLPAVPAKAPAKGKAPAAAAAAAAAAALPAGVGAGGAPQLKLA